MAFICIPKEKIDEFRKALKEKEIRIQDLLKMSTEERTILLEKYAGDGAKSINTLFEEKLILKNRLQGLKNWVSKIGEIGRYDPAKKALIDKALSDFRAKQQERIFNPQENQAFLNDLADKMLGTHITRTEAKTVFDLQMKADEIKKEGYNPNTQEWIDNNLKSEYGLREVASQKYIQFLNGDELPFKQLLGKRFNEFKSLYKENKLGSIYGLINDAVGILNRVSISVVASADDSFIGRQGYKTLLTNPKLWEQATRKSFIDIWDGLRGKGADTKDMIWAKVYSEPNYIEGRYQAMKILPRIEEQFQSDLPERLPLLGRVFKGAENAFNGSAIRMRTGLADIFLKIQKENGVNIDDPKILKDLGKFINSATARGEWGKLGSSEIIRLTLWAPKMLKSAVDTLVMPAYPNISPFVRTESAKLLLKFIAATALIKTTSAVLSPGSVENDPRSTDFKNLKFGNTRFQIPGIGELSLITLASRIVPTWHNGEFAWWYKASTGAYRKLGIGYGSQTPMDVVLQFLENKTTPLARTFIDILNGQTISGTKPTWAGESFRLITPIGLQNIIQLKDQASASSVLGTISDVFGFSANTYTPMSVDWSQNPGAVLQQFKDKVGDAKFKEANNKYNQEFNTWMLSLKDDSEFKQLSDADKQKAVTDKKAAIKDSIFKSYGFKYQPAYKPKF